MKCARCGAEYTNPVPEVVDTDGIREIVSADWCAPCNRFVAAIVWQKRSAYGFNPKIKSGADLIKKGGSDASL